MIFIPIIVFILGTTVGSFLNVVIYRLNTGRSFVSGRSRCVTCNRELHWHELIPVCSYLVLGGKCRTCKKKISHQYPIVELITGILFVVLYSRILLPLNFSYFSILAFVIGAIIMCLTVIIVVYDLKHKIIPTMPMRTLMAVSFVSVLFMPAFVSNFPLVKTLLAGPVIALPFLLIWFASSGKAMGFGDVKLALVIGWLFGISAGFSVLFVSFWIGGLVGLFLMAVNKEYKMKSEVPFAPFLALASVIVFITGFNIFNFFL